MPPHPTAATRTAAISLRQERPGAAFSLRVGDILDAIGGALKAAF
jgi:hypothetical protein